MDASRGHHHRPRPAPTPFSCCNAYDVTGFSCLMVLCFIHFICIFNDMCAISYCRTHRCQTFLRFFTLLFLVNISAFLSLSFMIRMILNFSHAFIWESTKVSHKSAFALLTPEIHSYEMAQMLQKNSVRAPGLSADECEHPFV